MFKYLKKNQILDNSIIILKMEISVLDESPYKNQPYNHPYVFHKLCLQIFKVTQYGKLLQTHYILIIL